MRHISKPSHQSTWRSKTLSESNRNKKDIQEFLTELNKSGREIGSENEDEQIIKLKLQERIEKIDKKKCQLMLAAEKKCGNKKREGMFWYSTALKLAAQK